ncbi:hypothetical protein M404DRAFT_999342 [Pisolithus tinctorius Marx 270]|uniref:Uncharacterized protein n=1 Tax=Pisolithus tinctorius Marx 270 TaxID=870435 RepID=A0A0C3PDB5_PISTI|nr:hypothetical protein M404DRAFT_999342 [Pisolithus tinctorius Marx 270]
MNGNQALLIIRHLYAGNEGFTERLAGNGYMTDCQCSVSHPKFDVFNLPSRSLKQVYIDTCDEELRRANVGGVETGRHIYKQNSRGEARCG